MSAQQRCTNCTRPAQLFLCPGCITELRRMLRELPGWIEALTDEVHGQTRKGESVRRSTEKTGPLLCNLDASEQLNYTRSVLTEWVRDLCETRGVQAPSLQTTPHMCGWLAAHVTAIASDQGAVVCFREIREITRDIQRLVDLPRVPAFYGPCPALLADNYGERVCNEGLSVKPGARGVQCPACKTTHTVAGLIDLRLADPWALFTASQVLQIMNSDHVREPVPESTWRRWRALGHVQPAGELYGEPAYHIEDVREFRRKWTRKKCG